MLDVPSHSHLQWDHEWAAKSSIHDLPRVLIGAVVGVLLQPHGCTLTATKAIKALERALARCIVTTCGALEVMVFPKQVSAIIGPSMTDRERLFYLSPGLRPRPSSEKIKALKARPLCCIHSPLQLAVTHVTVRVVGGGFLALWEHQVLEKR